MSLALRSLLFDYPYYYNRYSWLDDLNTVLTPSITSTQVNKTENGVDYRFSFPGLRREDLNIELEDNGILHIYGSSEVKSHNHSQKVSYSESVSVPKSVCENDVHVSYSDGLLHVHVPFKGTREPNKRMITIH